MTEAQHETLVDLMMDDVPADIRIVREFCCSELLKIAPCIDNWLREAEMRGKLEAWYAICEEQQREARVALKYRAPDEIQIPF